MFTFTLSRSAIGSAIRLGSNFTVEFSLNDYDFRVMVGTENAGVLARIRGAGVDYPLFEVSREIFAKAVENFDVNVSLFLPSSFTPHAFSTKDDENVVYILRKAVMSNINATFNSVYFPPEIVAENTPAIEAGTVAETENDDDLMSEHDAREGAKTPAQKLAEANKRKAGRPRKNAGTPVEETAKRKPGRPRKNAETVAETETIVIKKNRVGRPRISK